MVLEMGAIAFRGRYHDPLGLTGMNSSRFPGIPSLLGDWCNREAGKGLAAFPGAMSGKETGELACPAGLPGWRLIDPPRKQEPQVIIYRNT